MGGQDLVVINESGLYSLILSSKLPGAKRFKHWVTSEVLPAIRKNGGYISGQESLSDSELIAKALIVAQKTLEDRNRQLEEQKPKVLFADAVETSHTSILIGDLAKLIKQNGVDIGQKRLFQWLRDHGYLIKDGNGQLITRMDLSESPRQQRSPARDRSTSSTSLFRNEVMTCISTTHARKWRLCCTSPSGE